MREKVKGKLRSRQGMTLLLSLLLFLVCAVAGSVALTAGTASSGTISERAELDQRYFSVMSAAEILREAFDGKSVRVELDETGDVAFATVKIQRKSGNSEPEYVTVERDEDGSWKNAEAEEKFVIEQSLYLLNAFNAPEVESIKTRLSEYQVIVKDKDEREEIKALKATVEISRIAPGTLEFIVKSNIYDDEFGVKMGYSIASFEPISDVPDGFMIQWKIDGISLAD